MRADRLLQMMLILQTRGKMTARELSKELEVSERTIYRDVIALSSAGVPIYSEKGPGGGILLVEDYRTSLTGLSQEEVHALFMISVPAAMLSLGVSEELKRAMLKLSASLPNSMREAEIGVRQRILIDAEWLKGVEPDSQSSIKALYRAVWEDRRVKLHLQYAFGVKVAHIVDAYSLINRGGDWLFVCRINQKFRVLRFTDIWSLEILEDHFIRKPEFNLEQFWNNWKARMSEEEPSFSAVVRISSSLLNYLSRSPTVDVVTREELSTERLPVRATLKFSHFEEAKRILLGHGEAVKVISPLSLVLAVQDYALQTLRVYED